MTTAYGYIYKITNTLNGKVYIGQTTRGFDARYQRMGEGIERVYRSHLANKRAGRNYNEHLLSAIEKYGFSVFTVEKEYAVAYSRKELDQLEIDLISYFNAADPDHGYNSESGGGNGKPNAISRRKMAKCGEKNGFYGRHHSEETREHLKTIKSGKYTGEQNPNFGHKWTEEQRSKASKARLGIPNEKSRGRKVPREVVERQAQYLHEAYASGKIKHPRLGAHWSIEDKRKMSERMIGRYTGTKNSNHKKVICVTTGKCFEMINDAAEYAGVCASAISAALHTPGRRSGKINGVRLEWKFAE